MSLSFAFLPQPANAVAYGTTEVKVIGLGLIERTDEPPLDAATPKPDPEPEPEPPNAIPPQGQDYRATWVCLRRDTNSPAFLVENEDLAFYSG